MVSHVVIVVLGDLGRSPRMQYHANSFCNSFPSATVTLIGYQGEALIPQLNSIQPESLKVVRIMTENFDNMVIMIVYIKQKFLH